MSLRLLFAAILLPAMFLPAHHGHAGDAKKTAIISADINGIDLQFLKSAAEQGLLQANLGELAEMRALSSEVKVFGQTLAKYHATQNEQIKLLAIKKGVTVPASPTSQQNVRTGKLEKLQGLKFDKACMEEICQEQQIYDALFEQATQSDDPDIKAFATAALPSIKRQLAFVRDITGSAPRAGSVPHFKIGVGDPAKN